MRKGHITSTVVEALGTVHTEERYRGTNHGGEEGSGSKQSQRSGDLHREKYKTTNVTELHCIALRCTAMRFAL